MLTRENLIDKLMENFKEFKEQSDYDSEDLKLVYMVVGDLVIYFRDKVLESKVTPSEIDQFFDFLNQMANSNDTEVENILVVGMLEMLIDYPETINLAGENLNSRGKELLEMTINWWKKMQEDSKNEK